MQILSELFNFVIGFFIGFLAIVALWTVLKRMRVVS